MKKNGYLRRFLALFLALVMIMADSSVTTFAATVGMVSQQNAVQDVEVTVTGVDGTYYLSAMQSSESNQATSKVAKVEVTGGTGTVSLESNQWNRDISSDPIVMLSLKQGSSYNAGESYDQNKYDIIRNGGILKCDNGKVCSVSINSKTVTLTQIPINAGTSKNFRNILGSSTNFGIVANEATFRGHLESNFAIGKLNFEGSNVQMAKNNNGGAGYNYIGEFVGDNKLQIGLNGNAGGSIVYAGKGVEGKIKTDDSELIFDFDTYTESQIKGIVSGMVNEIKTTSTTLYNEPNSVAYESVKDKKGDEYTNINIAKYGAAAGTYYIRFQPGEFNSFMNSSNCMITIREDQNIVLNIPDTTVDFNQFKFRIVDANGNIIYEKTTNANSDEDRVAQNVIFNCPYATTAATHTATGIFLVPNATFTNAAVSAGWVIADTIAAIGGQEWHNVFHGMTVVDTSFQIKVTKNVDGKVASESKYDGKFHFELLKKNGDSWTSVKTVTNTNETVLFNDLGKFETEGTHYYKIVETKSDLSDVTIDNKAIYVKADIKKNGNKLVATVTYYSDENYSTTMASPSFDNKSIPKKVEIKVTKVWDDKENQDRLRPESIKVQLYADNVKAGDEVTLSDSNNWSYTWKDLDQKNGENDIAYTVEEVGKVSGYTTVVTGDAETGFIITNTHTPETTKVEGSKTWDDADNQDGKRADSITVRLLADGKETASKTVTADDGWKYSFTDLPKYADGKEIVYTVTEDTVPDYTTKINGYNITNSYTPGKTSISVTKAWNDSNDQDGKRAKEIKVQLYADKTAKGEAVVLNEGNKWTYTWNGLDAKKAGKDITYTVEEVGTVSGYTIVVTGDAETGFIITNTHTPETTKVEGSKTWDDADNQDGKRPESITVNLLADGKITATKTVTAKDNWTYSFADLPKYANGQEITYTVSEIPVPEYTTTTDDNYNITNSYTPGQTSASVTKIWVDGENQDGIRPESITVALLANGKPTEKTVTLNAANNWKQTITGLPEKENGEYITYTWTEVNVPEGYSLTGTSKTGIVTTLTNTHTPELTSISGTKTWNDADNQDGKRPESITVNLFANGTLLTSQTVSADADGNWSYSFTDLPKYANGQEITYTVTEDTVEGYTTELDGNNIINTHQPETTEITGTKTWNDANNQDGKRPESITVILLANGAEKDRQTVTADEAGNWTYTFKNLPKYANGQEITYTVAEEEVTDYTTTYDGNNIINSYTPGKTSATVTKIWNDADNQDGKRPESITVSLLADGEATGETVTLSAENNWTQTVSDLPEKANGKAIEYTWTEETLPEGYELTDNSKNGTVTTLTNTYAPETTSITGTKTWDDADNQDGKRPESIIINLLANGEIAASQTVTADGAGNWTYTFTDLPKYANGEEITYTVTEEAVEGYETSVDGFNITNAYTTETTEVKGSKTWNDADDQDGKRPESITVRLLANGEEKDSKTVTADENGNWTYSFENLPKYEAGKEIVYTVTEDAVADYTTEITGYDITNSYAPGKTSVTVTKAWADNNDRDGHRPKEIKVQLKADGENSGEKITLNAENKWTYTWSDLDQKKAGKDIVYTVEETSETTGYISAVTGDAAEGFVITNTITSVKISKVDITDQKELAGAHIQVIDKDGNVVDEWDSTWESHEVTGLKTGEKYTLRETVAPDGYTVTTDTTFVLKEDGTLDKDNTSTTIADDGRLLVEDSRTSVKVSKVDISDGEELEGAHIQIIDGDGNIVDEWDSTKEAHVTEKLKTGKTYTLRETVAPDGYLLTTDTTFVLKEDGTVDTEKTTTVSKDGVLLVQDSLATSASIAVTKRLTYVGENLVAKDQTFYVALYSDEECTKRVSDVKALEFKNSNASTVVFSENIKAGKTYYIAECTKDGISQVIGALADGTTYEAVFGDGNSTTVTEADGTTTVSFENVFSSFPPDGFYRQGQLTITKRVLGADGDTKNSDKVFYAGIFDDAAHTQLSQQVEQNIIELKMDGGYEVSEIINVGLAQPGTKVTLYVAETDSNGKPIAGSEDFGYKVSVSADSVTIDDTNMTAEVVITNQEEATETPTPTPSSDGGNGGGSEDHSGSYGGKSPKTGDDTPIGTYLMLLLAAAMLAAETERRRRRNKR